MRIFITGATGWVGSAVVPDLLAAGHEVVALARSEAAASAVAAAGAIPWPGSLDDHEALGAAASASDGVIHLAYRHDLAFAGDPGAAAATDLLAVQALGAELAGSGKPLVIATGLAGLPAGRVATELDIASSTGPGGQRAAASQTVLSFAAQGVRSAVVRLPPTVHGAGDTGFMPIIVGIARDRAVSGYVGDGSNRWPAVHRLDAARLFRLALEEAPAGSVLHGVHEQGIATWHIAEAIGRHLEVPSVSIAPEAAADHFGWLGGLWGGDHPASSVLTREITGWEPVRATVAEDLDAGHYFA